MSTLQQNRSEFGLTNWAEEHGLIHQLLPLEHRENNPIEILTTLSNHFDEWHRTKATWRYREVPIPNSAIRGCEEQGLLLPNFVGSYMVQESNRKTRWTNPNYVHGHDATAIMSMDQLEFIKENAHMGILSCRELADRMDLNYRTIQYHCRENIGKTWGELRREGQKRIVRTALAIAEWTDYTRTELARLFTIPESTFRDWMDFVDFEIPPEPILTR